MEAYQLALIESNEPVAAEQFRIAYELESEAAHSFLNRDLEPTRSVLFRSAATMAKRCGLTTEMHDLIQKGLAGNPPPAVADELRELLDTCQRKS